jgi:cholesterol oxidase
MAGFDYDVMIIGSGFGGSVAALRAAEKGRFFPRQEAR